MPISPTLLHLRNLNPQKNLEGLGNVERFISTDHGLDYHSLLIDYAPGNGWIYRFIVNTIPEEQMIALGVSPEHVMVTIENPFNNGNGPMFSRPIRIGGMHVVHWVSERFCIQDSRSAGYVTALLNLLFGDEAFGIEYGKKVFNAAKEG